MVAYFRAYCREKLGQSAVSDYAGASKLSSAYVFPNTSLDMEVLRAAIAANPSDGTAHYLLGTFYFSKGETDPALEEWAAARQTRPDLPVLAASTGLAYLHIENDPQRALAAFREGMRSDPDNVQVYLGADQALSLLKHSPTERAAALESYPKLATAPPPLVYELIMNLAEAGEFDRAEALFRNRYFPREEGGTNVRQVWIELQLQRIVDLSRAGKCGEALSRTDKIGSPVTNLGFTENGLQPFLNSARTQYLLAEMFGRCEKKDQAKDAFATAASATSPDQVRWAYLAAKQLPGFNEKDWQARLETALQQAEARAETSQYPSWWMYSAGLLARELGDTDEAETRFRRALLLPDRMLAYHLTRMVDTPGAQNKGAGQ